MPQPANHLAKKKKHSNTIWIRPINVCSGTMYSETSNIAAKKQQHANVHFTWAYRSRKMRHGRCFSLVRARVKKNTQTLSKTISQAITFFPMRKKRFFTANVCERESEGAFDTPLLTIVGLCDAEALSTFDFYFRGLSFERMHAVASITTNTTNRFGQQYRAENTAQSLIQ